MSEGNYKVGDVVMSIYPPDGDETYYNAKIVEVGDGVRACV